MEMEEKKTSVRREIVRPALVATVVAGVLDITAAIVTSAFRGVAPIRILQSIASGLLGKEAYSGGLGTAALGIVLHFSLMLAFAFAYMLAFERSLFMRAHALWSGAVYGVAIYIFMNAVVLPLSAFPHKLKYDAALLTIGILTHILCVGLPIAAIAKKYGSSA
jgi:uncharacterized membrane protein YagU involved in acid resistance